MKKTRTKGSRPVKFTTGLQPAPAVITESKTAPPPDDEMPPEAAAAHRPLAPMHDAYAGFDAPDELAAAMLARLADVEDKPRRLELPPEIRAQQGQHFSNCMHHIVDEQREDPHSPTRRKYLQKICVLCGWRGEIFEQHAALLRSSQGLHVF